MSNILVLDDSVNNHWRVKREEGKWVAWIYDPEDEATGAPLFTSYDFDLLVDKMAIYELGQSS